MIPQKRIFSITQIKLIILDLEHIKLLKRILQVSRVLFLNQMTEIFAQKVTYLDQGPHNDFKIVDALKN